MCAEMENVSICPDPTNVSAGKAFDRTAEESAWVSHNELKLYFHRNEPQRD